MGGPGTFTHTQKTGQKFLKPENMSQIPKAGTSGVLGPFFLDILGDFLRVQNVGPGGICSISVEFPSPAISGIAGRGVLNAISQRPGRDQERLGMPKFK